MNRKSETRSVRPRQRTGGGGPGEPGGSPSESRYDRASVRQGTVTFNLPTGSTYNLTNATAIGTQAFNGCGLTSINIPDSVTLIDISAFNNNPSLTKAIVGSGVTEVRAPDGGMRARRFVGDRCPQDAERPIRLRPRHCARDRDRDAHGSSSEMCWC